MQSLTIARIQRELMAEVGDLLRPYNVELPDDDGLDRADSLMVQFVMERTRQLRADPRFAARQSAHDEAVAERRAARMKQLDAERAAEELRAHYRAQSEPARLWTRIARLEEELAQRDAAPPPPVESPAPEISA